MKDCCAVVDFEFLKTERGQAFLPGAAVFL